MIIDPKAYRMAHPVYSMTDIEEIVQIHRKPDNLRDKVAFNLVKLMRNCFDYASGYNEKGMNTEKWLNRVVFLETVAGVPGMVGGMTRHLKSLRSLQPDYGWIHNLL